MMDLTTIARPYAQAVFEYASEQHALDQWQSMLSVLAQCIADPDVMELLKNPTYSADQHAAMCGAFISSQPDIAQQNFIKVLAQGDRLSALPAIFALFIELRLQAENILPVAVKSAFPLEQDDLKKIDALLSTQFHQSVSVKTEVDKSLIGGILIRAGDRVIDGSVRGQLDRLKRVAVD